MKKLIPVLVIALLAIVGYSLYQAQNVGEKSPIYLGGTIEVSPDLKENIDSQNTLFLVLYDQNSPMPMPYGAIKETIEPSQLKDGRYDFLITKEKLQVMSMGNENPKVPELFRLKVRVDRDGVGGRDQPGDISGQLTGLPYGKKDVAIKLDTLIP